MNTIEWLKKLISFNTVSSESNLPLIDCIADWLTEQQVTFARVPQEASKSNLLAAIPDKSGNYSGGILLSGHTDVVPITGQHWESDPFVAEVRAEKLYGRGAADMKGFLAVVLALVPYFKEAKLERPIHLAFSYDEEVGCKGVSSLIHVLTERNHPFKLCIVGEPTEMQPVIAHKGIHQFSCRFYGKCAHSSLTPLGVNAIEYSAKLINYLRTLAENFKNEGPFDLAFDVPFTTITTNKIAGGIARNIIPEFCEIFFEFRHLPETLPIDIIHKIENFIQAELLPAMRKENTEAKIDLEVLADAPGFQSTFTDLAKLPAYAEKEQGHKVAFVTEAGFFERAGIPTIVCGPGSIKEAHKENEFITLEQLTRCEAFLKTLPLIKL